MKKLRYRLGAWLLTPLARDLQSAYRSVPNEHPTMPVVGGSDFAEQQAWVRDIAGYNAIEEFKRHAATSAADLVGLGRRWPLPGWEKRVQASVQDFRNDFLPWNVVYNPGGLERHAKRIHRLKERCDGLEDVLLRLYQHRIDDIPADLAAEIEVNLGWRREAHVARPYGMPDEGWTVPSPNAARPSVDTTEGDAS